MTTSTAAKTTKKTPAKSKAKTSPFAAKVKAPAPSTANTNMHSAEAFGNIEVEFGGETHKIPKGAPLHSNNRVSRSLINAAKKRAADGKEFSIQVTMTVKLVADESGLEDIAFV